MIITISTSTPKSPGRSPRNRRLATRNRRLFIRDRPSRSTNTRRANRNMQDPAVFAGTMVGGDRAQDKGGMKNACEKRTQMELEALSRPDNA